MNYVAEYSKRIMLKWEQGIFSVEETEDYGEGHNIRARGVDHLRKNRILLVYKQDTDQTQVNTYSPTNLIGALPFLINRKDY